MHYSRSSHKLNPTHMSPPPLPLARRRLPVSPAAFLLAIVPILSLLLSPSLFPTSPFLPPESTSLRGACTRCVHGRNAARNVSSCANQLVSRSSSPRLGTAFYSANVPFSLSKCVYLRPREERQRGEMKRGKKREREREELETWSYPDVLSPCYTIADLIKLMRTFRSKRGQRESRVQDTPTLSLTLLFSLSVRRSISIARRSSFEVPRSRVLDPTSAFGSYSDDEGRRNWVWILLNANVLQLLHRRVQYTRRNKRCIQIESIPLFAKRHFGDSALVFFALHDTSCNFQQTRNVISVRSDLTLSYFREENMSATIFHRRLIVAPGYFSDVSG